jgi:hypothetical protein
MADISITSGKHPNDLPTLTHTININGVSINLSKDDFMELCYELDSHIGENLKEAKLVYDKYWLLQKTSNEILKDKIMQTFFDDKGDWKIHVRQSEATELINYLQDEFNVYDF